MVKSKARIFLLTEEQERLLNALRDEITDNGGYISFSQLFRDSVNILLQDYRDEIIQRYVPIKVVKSSGKE